MDDKPPFDPNAAFTTDAPSGGDKPSFDPNAAFTTEPPAMTAGETAWDVAKSGGIGLAKGAIGLLGMPGDIGELGAKGIDWATQKVGGALGMDLQRPGTEPSVVPRPPMLPLPGSADIQKSVESLTGEFYKPKTALGRYAETAGEFAPALIGGPEALGTKLATRVAAPAIVGQTAEEMFQSPYAKSVGAVAGALGASGLAGAVRSIRQPEVNAATDLSRAIQRDTDTPEVLALRLQEAQQIRPEATLADVGGENVRGLVERVAQTPGAGRSVVVPALEARQRGQLNRIEGDLASLTGTQRTAFQAVQDTMATRAQSAAPLYQEAYNAGDRAIWSPELERLTAAPPVQAAMRRAVGTWQTNAIADGYGAMNPGAVVDRGGQLRFLNGRVPVFPNIQFWDYTKRMMDDQISSAIRAGQNQKARALTALNRSLRGELDRAVPEYAAARQSWAGPSQYLDAIEEGRGIMSRNMTAEELRANLGNMTEAQREAYRIGAVGAVINDMRRNAANLPDLARKLNSPEMREKIAAIMPTPETADGWLRRLDYELQSSGMTRRALGNSATPRRLAEADQARGLVTDLAMHAIAHGVTGHGWVQWLRGAMSGVARPIRDTLRSRSDRILGDVFTNPQADVGSVLGAAGQRGLPPNPLRVTVPALTYGAPMLRARGGRIWHPAQTGAKRARDRSWYVPDPNRQGKYLKVEMKRHGASGGRGASQET